MSEPANTPDAFPPEQFDLIAFCDACGHSAPIDRGRIPPGLTNPELPARLRCTACGGRTCSMRIVYLADRGQRDVVGKPMLASCKTVSVPLKKHTK